MTMYQTLYKMLEGTGVSRSPLVTKINDMIIASQIRGPILIKKQFYMYLDPRPPSNTAAMYLAKREYDPNETLLIENTVKRDSVAIDIGANIGYYSLLLAQKCKRVWAFEPTDYTFGLLTKNIEYNKLQDKIIAEKVAISDKEQKLKLYHAYQNSGGNSVVPMAGCDSSSYEIVACTTLDKVIPNQRIDFMKIDVEGHEEQVLGGGKRTLENTEIVLIEYNKVALKEIGRTGKEIFELLKEFDINQVTEEGRLKSIKRFEELNDVKHYCNLWCTRSR